MTTPTIRDHCAAQVNDVAYLLECVQYGSFDPITLQEISDRADDARDALAAEPAGEVGEGSDYDQEGAIAAVILDHSRVAASLDCPDPERNLGRVLRESDFGATARAILTHWGRPATPPEPEVGEMGKVGELVAWLRSIKSLQAQRAATRLSQFSAPAPAVVAVSERLPGGGDCDAEGRCWAFMPLSATPFPNWTLIWRGHMKPYHSHWLPAHAIPLPQAGEVE